MEGSPEEENAISQASSVITGQSVNFSPPRKSNTKARRVQPRTTENITINEDDVIVNGDDKKLTSKDRAKKVALVTFVCFIVFFVLWLLQRIILGIWVPNIQSPSSQRRVETLTTVLYSFSILTLIVVFVFMIFQVLGLPVVSLFATFGILGIAIGFGAQSLFKDLFSGFLILSENQASIGDWVHIGDQQGRVEQMTFRYIRLRDDHGNEHFIPTGSIQTIVNTTRGYAQALMNVHFPSDMNPNDGMNIVSSIARSLAIRPVAQGGIKDWILPLPEELDSTIDPRPFPFSEFLFREDDDEKTKNVLSAIRIWNGVSDVTPTSYTITVQIRSHPGKQGDIERRFNEIIVETFQLNKIPFVK